MKVLRGQVTEFKSASTFAIRFKSRGNFERFCISVWREEACCHSVVGDVDAVRNARCRQELLQGRKSQRVWNVLEPSRRMMRGFPMMKAEVFRGVEPCAFSDNCAVIKLREQHQARLAKNFPDRAFSSLAKVSAA